MRNGFTFNNRHSSLFGVTVKTKSRPIRPEAKSFTLDMPCRDGEYDFSSSNPHGREHYRGRVFAFSLAICAETLRDMQKKLSDISLWLCGSGELIFDDIPLVRWSGKIIDEIIYLPEHGGKNAMLDVTFKAQPFGECVFDTDGPKLLHEIRLDDELPIGLDECFTFSASQSKSVDIINFGDMPVMPVISITGGSGNIGLILGDKMLKFNVSGDTVVDFEHQCVLSGEENKAVGGEFFEFVPGHNDLEIVAPGINGLEFTVRFTPQFMYAADFENTEWGTVNA